jgi:hypothetical protein
MDLIIRLISDYGAVAGLATIIAVGLFYYFKHTLFGEKKDESASHSNVTSDGKKKLAYHSFFANANYRLSIEIPNLEILPSKPVKQQMYRDILNNYIKAIVVGCQDISEIDVDAWGSERWCAEMVKKFNEIIFSFNTTCKANGVPDVVISKFSKWHQSTLEFLYENIMSIGNSAMFSSNTERTNTLFHVLNLLLVITISDAEKTIKELNGEVSGKIYNGKVIEE